MDLTKKTSYVESITRLARVCNLCSKSVEGRYMFALLQVTHVKDIVVCLDCFGLDDETFAVTIRLSLAQGRHG